jgi:hypothetical protein
MLTYQDLLIIQVAIRYFGEEMLSHNKAMPIDGYVLAAINSHFAGPPDACQNLTREDIVSLSQRLSSCRLRWARSVPNEPELLDQQLLHCSQVENLTPEQAAELATVLIPSTA